MGKFKNEMKDMIQNRIDLCEYIISEMNNWPSEMFFSDEVIKNRIYWNCRLLEFKKMMKKYQRNGKNFFHFHANIFTS